MLSVRRADPADIGSIKALDPVARSDPRRAVAIDKAVSDGDCQVAESDGVIAGYLVLRTDFFGQGFVWLLVVAAHQRRQGLGEILMAAAERTCPTAKLFTSTNRSNGPMRSLLTKQGYEEVGTIEGLDEGDPEVFYLKRLAAQG